MTLAPILGALVVRRRHQPIVRIRTPPWVVGCFLARALRGDAACGAIHEAAHQLLQLQVMDGFDPRCDEAMSVATALRDRAAELPPQERAPVVIAMLRDLLDDAPTRYAVEMDRALVTAARLCRTTPDAIHRELAARILAEVQW